jgi:hypothetical protein
MHIALREAKVVELRYFGGLTEEQIVAALRVSPRTVAIGTWPGPRFGFTLYDELPPTRPLPR